SSTVSKWIAPGRQTRSCGHVAIRLMRGRFDPDHGRLVKQTAAVAEDQKVHRSAIWTAMPREDAESPRIGRQLEGPRSRNRFARLQQDVQRHGCGSGLGTEPAASLVHEVNPGTFRSLSDASGAAVEAEINSIDVRRRCRRTLCPFHGQAPIIEAPRFAD